MRLRFADIAFMTPAFRPNRQILNRRCFRSQGPLICKVLDGLLASLSELLVTLSESLSLSELILFLALDQVARHEIKRHDHNPPTWTKAHHLWLEPLIERADPFLLRNLIDRRPLPAVWVGLARGGIP